jgi:TonB family protein
VPRSEAPPKPDVPRKEPPKKPVEQAPPRETPKRSANDILKAFSEQKAAPTLDELIKRRVGEASDEGHQEGSTLGTEITGRLKADYNDLLKARVQQAFALPTTLSDDERVRLWSNLYVKVGAAGELLDASLSPASGNSAFDAAVMAAARKASPFPAPPIQLRDFYRAGVGMKVCPLSCN